MIQQELRDWPYTIHQIDDTLNPDLIDGQGRQIIYQALNKRNLTVFIGSGVSAAYGRKDWEGWKETQISTVSELSKLFVKTSDGSIQLINQIDCCIKKIQAGNSNNEGKEHNGVVLDARGKTDFRLVSRWLNHREQVILRAQREVEALQLSFNAAKSDEGRFPGGEDVPILFEIARKLHDLLLQHNSLFNVKNKTSKNSGAEYDAIELSKFFGSSVSSKNGAPETSLVRVSQILTGYCEELTTLNSAFRVRRKAYRERALMQDASSDFHTVAKRLLVDECTHADELLLKGLKLGFREGRESNNADPAARGKLKRFKELENILSSEIPDNLKRDIDGIRDNPSRYRVLSAFRIEAFKSILKSSLSAMDDRNTLKLPGEWASALKMVLKHIENKEGAGAPLKPTRVYISPTSRFLVPMLDQLCFDPWENHPDTDELLKAPKPGSFLSRRSIIANRFDPLTKLESILGINRYLTTNYDFEIERMYQDKGYRQFDKQALVEQLADKEISAHSFRTNGLGGVLQDMTFSTDTATDLLTFSAGAERADASVFHLHGRATKHDNIVVTERDYTDMYLRSSPNREVVDESITMAFSATPILFMGLSMGESDLLRPLRQFISNQDRSLGYKAVVLLAATGNAQSRTKVAAGLYVRFGVYTVFYGSGLVEVKKSDSVSKLAAWAKRDKDIKCDSESIEIACCGSEAIDWLCHVSAIIETILTAAKSRSNLFTEPQEHPMGSGKTVTLESSVKFCSAMSEITEQYGSCKVYSDLEKPLLTMPKLDRKLGELSGTPGNVKRRALAAMLGVSNKALEVLDTFFSKVCLTESLDEWQSAVLNEFSLRDCVFTSQHPEHSGFSDVVDLAGVDGREFTEFNTKLLTEILKMALAKPNNRDSTVGERIRSLNAMVTTLEGLKGAFMTSTLNAVIEQIDLEWRNWWSDWQKPPLKREAKFEQLVPDSSKLLTKGRPNLPRRLVRHRVINAITNLQYCRTVVATQLVVARGKPVKVKIEPTRVQIFDSFIREIAQVSSVRVAPEGRLIQTVAASRGQGKGVFFSTLMTELGLTSYLSAAHPVRLKPKTRTSMPCSPNSIKVGSPIEPPLFVAAIFINLSFSPEIASNYDMLLDALSESVIRLRMVNNLIKEEIKLTNVEDFLRASAVDLQLLSKSCDSEVSYSAEMDKLRREHAGEPRIKKLKLLMRAFGEESSIFSDKRRLPIESRPRILIALNSTEILFDENRRAKNLEIAAYLRWIACNEASAYPFDFIFIGALEKLGGMWRSEKEPKRNTWIDVSNCGESWPKQNQEHIIKMATLCNVVNISELRDIPDSEFHYVHFARPVQPIHFLVDNFATLAISLYARKQRPGLISKTNESIKCGYNQLWARRNRQWAAYMPPDIAEIYNESKLEMHMYLSSAVIIDKDDNNCGASETHFDALKNKIICSYDSQSDGAQEKQDWRELLNVIGYNRFCLTILLAAAEHLVFSADSVVKGGHIADSFLKKTLNQLRHGSVSQVENVILKTVMGVYREASIIGSPDQDFELHELLMRNLAVLGCSVSPNVLVRLPTIRDYFNKTSIHTSICTKDPYPTEEHSRRRLVARALSSLCEKGLVFRLSPHPKLLYLQDDVAEKWDEWCNKDSFKNYLCELGESFDCVSASSAAAEINDQWYGFKVNQEEVEERDSSSNETFDKFWAFKQQQAIDFKNRCFSNKSNLSKFIFQAYEAFRSWPAEREYRYALHRQVQVYCFKRLGHLSAPPVVANNFAPSLYASSPSRVIRLSKEGYFFLRRLLLGLSQYPDIRHSDSARDMPIFTDDNVITKAQALRAAMSMARTTFSIAAVSRFSDDLNNIGAQKKRGYFETYKVRLRWILRKSWDIHTNNGSGHEATDVKYRLNSLYRDEIIWLYNEIAVTCLLQGCLSDAIGYSRQAIYINQKNEGEMPGGPMHNILSLNLAIMQLERGRLRSAKRRLNEIIKTEAVEKKKVYYLATGYLGLLNQFMGHLGDAKSCFETATDGLSDDSDERSLAIMKNHYARLIVREDIDLARRELKGARQLSESGGHEDVRHRILLSEVWVSQGFRPTPQKRIQKDRLKLREIETYAYMMGIPSLLVDTLNAKGSLLLESGDASSSGKQLAKAMAIARRNDMNIRLNSLMTRYSHVLIARRRPESALRLLEAGLAMAKRCDYSTEVVRIHSAISEAKRSMGEGGE